MEDPVPDIHTGETYIEGYEETFKENGKHCDNNLKEFPRCSIESCNRSAHENSKVRKFVAQLFV